MKRLIAILLGLVMLLTPLGYAQPVLTCQIQLVTATALRNAPQGEIIGQLPAGDTYTLSDALEDETGTLWYRILLSDGRSGFVKAADARNISLTALGTVISNFDHVPLLDAPSGSAKTISEASRNESFAYYAKNSGFYQVLRNGQPYWVNENYMIEMTQAPLSNQSLRLITEGNRALLLGETFTVQAVSSGFSKPEFRFFVFDGTQKKLLRDWGALSIFHYTPTVNGYATIIAEVREENMVLPSYLWAQARVTFTTSALVTLEAPTAYSRQPLEVKAVARGVESPLYRFFEKKANVLIPLGDFSTKSSVSLTPSSQMELAVWVKDAKSLNQYDATNSLTILPKAPTIENLILRSDYATYNPGDQINLFATVTAPEGTTFEWKLVSPEQSLLKAASLDDKLQLFAGEIGSYTYRLTATLADGSLSKSADLKLNVTDKTVTAVYLQSSAESFFQGKPVLFTATSRGSSHPLYRFEIRDANANTSVLQDWGTKDSLSFTPSAKGNFTVTVYAKDSSASDVQQYASKSFLVGASALSALRLFSDIQDYSYGLAPIDLSAWSSGSAYPLYRFDVRENGVWKTLKGYSDEQNARYEPTGFGDVIFRVYAKDIASAAQYDLFYDLNFSIRDFSKYVSLNTSYTSPNFFEGRQGFVPDLIVDHITEGTAMSAVNHFLTVDTVSAHFVIGRDGKVYQMVDLRNGAWTNGNKADLGFDLNWAISSNPVVNSRDANANLFSVTIENEGWSSSTKGNLTSAQLLANIETTKYIGSELKRIYGVNFVYDRNHILGHYEIDPINKALCPGAYFPYSTIINSFDNTRTVNLEAQKLQTTSPKAILKPLGSLTISAKAGTALCQTAGGAVITTVPYLTKLVIEQLSGKYAYVTYNGKKGWIDQTYTTKKPVGTPAIAPPANKLAYQEPLGRPFAGKLQITSPGNLMMRDAPNSEGEYITGLPYLTVVDYYGLSGGWYQIFYNGKVGYIYSYYTKPYTSPASQPTPAPTPAALGTILVTAPDGLNIRSTASSSAGILGVVPYQTQLNYYSYASRWYKIIYNGVTGFIYDYYTKPVSAPSTPTPPPTSAALGKIRITAPDGLNLRSAASGTARILTSIPYGTEVEYFSYANRYYEVSYSGLTGYVYDYYTKKVEASAPTPTPVLTTPTTTSLGMIRITAIDGLNVRSTASTGGKILTSIPYGASVEYLSYANRWYQVSYNGVTGYIYDYYTQKLTAPAAVSSGTKTVTTTASNGLNLRSSATTSSAILGKIPYGTSLSVLAESGNWYKVTYQGKTGWISKSYTK